MSLFVSNTADGYTLTTAGYVLTAIILVAVLVIAALLAKKKASPRPQPPAVIQYEDNSVHIGNGNKISNSTIGSKNAIVAECEISNPAPEKEKLASKLFWQILIPVAVVVIGALVCIWLGIDT